MKENLYVMFLLVAIQAFVVSCLFDFTFREILGVSWVVLIHVMLITQILDHVDNKGDDKK